MKNLMLKSIGIIATAIMISFTSCEESAINDLDVTTASEESTDLAETDAQTTETIDDDAKSSLVFMREEEKLAHDVYVYMFDLWGLNTFNNISKSETTHTDAVKGLLDYYGIEDITLPEEGKFANEDLQDLYDALIDMGDSSLVDGLLVGATIEEVDIIDLDEAMATCDVDTIVTVYSRLRKGSTNHLKAFVSQLDAQGIAYTPQYLSQEEYDEIINN